MSDLSASWPAVIGFIILLTGLEVAAEVMLKPHGDNGYGALVALGCMSYVAIGVLLAFVLRQMPDKLGVINTIWQALNIVLVFSVSFLWFGEDFHWMQYTGVVVAMLAAVLMVVPELQK